MGDVIVTPTIAHVGMKVRRGKDWCYSHIQDENGIGQIVRIEENTVFPCRVKWENGGEWCYRMGADNKFDLYVATPSDIKKEWAPKVGDVVKFARHYSDSSGASPGTLKVTFGGTGKVTEVTERFARIDGGTWWLSHKCLDPVSETQNVREKMAEVILPGPAQPPPLEFKKYESSQISKPIKAKSNDTKRSVSAIRRECGSAFKVFRKAPIIGKRKGYSKDSVHSGRPKAQSGRAHS